MSEQGSDRRRETRITASHEVRVEVGTAILDRELGTGSLGPLALYGHTRDLSPSGLGIVIPTADVGPRHSGESLPARVRVALPGGGVEVEAEAIHWAPLGEMGLGRGVLIGVRVTGGGESLRSLLRGPAAAAEDGRASPGGEDGLQRGV